MTCHSPKRSRHATSDEGLSAAGQLFAPD